MTEVRTTSRKTRVGKVVSDKMDKTVVVIVEDRVVERVRHRRQGPRDGDPSA